MNMTRTRKQRRDASKRYQELNRELKRACRRDKRMYVESAAERTEEAGKRSDVKTLYKITRRMSDFRGRQCKPVRNQAGILIRIVEEETHR